MIKGNQAERVEVKNNKYIGLTQVEVRAVNPSRSELNKLLGKEDSDDDRDIEYASTDAEGNRRVRLSFWLYEPKLDKYFVHSFNLTEKQRVSKDGLKTQYINSVCMTAWAEDTEKLPSWFTHFLDKDKTELGEKDVRAALLGEEELGTLLRSWMGRMPWSKPTSGVMIDTDNLFREDYSELRSIIDGQFDTPFVILLGVRTDENDSEKQYQQVWGKGFLPRSFMKGIENKFKFTNDFERKTWARFDSDVTGEYGFQAHFDLVPVKEYNKDEDVAASPTAKAGVTPTNSKY